MKKEFAIFSTLLFVFFDTIVLTSQALVRTTSNDYAIIINTGRDVTNNHDYYWNDCSEIYKLLMVCGYDRNNIYVLMSDGKSTGQDMNMGNGVYQDSPKDLDGDGIDDVNYSASADTLRDVLDRFGALSQYDNVFIYVTGPADVNGDLIFWGNTTMSMSDFVQELHKLQGVKTVNLVMQTCYSGGYVMALRSQANCVVTTACDCNELAPTAQFQLANNNLTTMGVFTYFWKEAILLGYTNGPAYVRSDYNQDGFITMNEAFRYALTWPQMVNYYHVTPQFTSPISQNYEFLGDFLTLKGTYGKFIQFPLDYDLVVRDNVEDNGRGTSTTLPQIGNNGIGAVPLWIVNSPDMWCRRFCDGGTQHQMVLQRNKFYVYTKVRNFGTTASSGIFDTLEIYTNKTSLANRWKGSWIKIASTAIPAINSGDSVTLCMQVIGYDFANDVDQYSILAFIKSSYEPLGSLSNTYTMSNVSTYNNIAAKNLFALRKDGILATYDGVEAPAGVVNIGSSVGGSAGTGGVVTGIRFASPVTETSLASEAEITVALSDAVLALWPEDSRHHTGFEQLNDNTFRIKDAEAELTGFMLHEDENAEANITVSANFLTAKNTDATDFYYNVLQYDTETDEVIGAATVFAEKPERMNFFRAKAGNDTVICTGTDVVLSAQNIGEDAVYKWYTMDKTLLHKGMGFDTALSQNTSFILEVTAMSDGFKDYDTINISVRDSYITSITPNPATGNSVSVGYVVANTISAKLIVYSATSGLEAGFYPLNLNATSQQIDISTLPQGSYLISLVCDGNPVDSKILVKQ